MGLDSEWSVMSTCCGASCLPAVERHVYLLWSVMSTRCGASCLPADLFQSANTIKIKLSILV
jgi:hypothetical protein